MRLLPTILLFALLAAITAGAQTTMMVVPSTTSDPASSDVPPVGEFWDTPLRSWFSTDPFAMLAGRPGYDIPPYARIMYYTPMSDGHGKFGLGVDIGFHGDGVGLVAALQGRISPLKNGHELIFRITTLVHGVNQNMDVWLGVQGVVGWQKIFWNHFLVNAGIGADWSKVGLGGSGSNSGLPTDAPARHYPRGYDFIFQMETGYVF